MAKVTVLRELFPSILPIREVKLSLSLEEALVLRALLGSVSPALFMEICKENYSAVERYQWLHSTISKLCDAFENAGITGFVVKSHNYGS